MSEIELLRLWQGMAIGFISGITGITCFILATGVN